MSEDKRLGANPLSWVSQEPAASSHLPGKEARPVHEPVRQPTPPTRINDSVVPDVEAAASPKPNSEADVTFDQEYSDDVTGQSSDRTCPPLFTIPESILQEELMSKGKVKIKETMDTAQAAAHLEDLANSLLSGVIRAENGEESVVLCTGESMRFEMKLSKKKGRAKCSIEMEWEEDDSKAEGFRISR